MRKFISLMLFLSCITVSSFALSLPSVTVNLYNQKVYTSDSEIEIQVHVRNAHMQPLRLKLAENRIHNIQLDVRTRSNDRLPEHDQCIKEITSSQPVYYSELNLKPAETFSFVIRLSDFMEIPRTGSYRLTLSFFTDFRNTAENAVVSNPLFFEIRSFADEPPEPAPAGSMPAAASAPALTSPDAVVKWTLDALTQHRWPDFFRYLDLEALYLKTGNNRLHYETLSETGRINQIEQYKTWLMKGEKDKDLLLVPDSYQIMKTTFTETDAQVVVRMDFVGKLFLDQKEAIYFLQKDNHSWKINDYEITNLLRTQQ